MTTYDQVRDHVKKKSVLCKTMMLKDFGFVLVYTVTPVPPPVCLRPMSYSRTIKESLRVSAAWTHFSPVCLPGGLRRPRVGGTLAFPPDSGWRPAATSCPPTPNRAEDEAAQWPRLESLCGHRGGEGDVPPSVTVAPRGQRLCSGRGRSSLWGAAARPPHRRPPPRPRPAAQRLLMPHLPRSLPGVPHLTPSAGTLCPRRRQWRPEYVRGSKVGGTLPGVALGPLCVTQSPPRTRRRKASSFTAQRNQRALSPFPVTVPKRPAQQMSAHRIMFEKQPRPRVATLKDSINIFHNRWKTETAIQVNSNFHNDDVPTDNFYTFLVNSIKRNNHLGAKCQKVSPRHYFSNIVFLLESVHHCVFNHLWQIWPCFADGELNEKP